MELDKLIFKTAWTNKRPRTVMTLLKEEIRWGGLACLILRLIMKVIIKGYGIGIRVYKWISRNIQTQKQTFDYGIQILDL